MTEQPKKKCEWCGKELPSILGDLPQEVLCQNCKDHPERQEYFKNIKSAKTYPAYSIFCDNPEKITGFKPARVAKWLYEHEHFKTDRKTGILYYGDEEKGVWTANGETVLEEICAKILGEENKAHHYSNILHDLKGLSYCDITFSNKVAVENGLLNVETKELTPFSLDEMAFYSLPVAYNPKMEYPNWLEFLNQVVNAEDTPTLQEWSGYLLLPDYRFHKLLWIHGPGRNGKGVWQRTMEGVLGQKNVSSVGLEEFDGSHRFAMRQLYGKLFNPCSEPTTNRILQTALLKKATGQDTISAECKGKDTRIEFRNAAKITVIANKFPKVSDTTTAFTERRLFVKFPNEFTGKEATPNLEMVWLNSSEEKSGILNWMLDGLQKLLAQGYFTESKSQHETEIEFQRVSDTIGAFIAEMVIFGKNLVTTRSDAFEAYKRYCDFIGATNESDKAFTNRLKNTPKIKPGGTRIKGQYERAWLGIALKPIPEDFATDATDATVLAYNIPLENFGKSKKEVGEGKHVATVASVSTNDGTPQFCALVCANYHNKGEYGCSHPNPMGLNEKTLKPLRCLGFKPIGVDVKREGGQ
jgi:putative DNA primase/helicase